MKKLTLTKDEAYTSIVGLYNAIAKKLDIPNANSYDCKKVRVGQDVMDACQKYHIDNGDDNVHFAMLWLNYGPKASLQGYAIEVDRGWYS